MSPNKLTISPPVPVLGAARLAAVPRLSLAGHQLGRGLLLQLLLHSLTRVAWLVTDETTDGNFGLHVITFHASIASI